MKESEIQRAILDWLKANNIFAWRVPLGPLKLGRGRTFNPMKGFPDIMGVLPDKSGRMFTIEVKSAKGKLSDDQKKWMIKLKESGVDCMIARTLEEVIQAFHPK